MGRYICSALCKAVNCWAAALCQLWTNRNLPTAFLDTCNSSACLFAHNEFVISHCQLWQACWRQLATVTNNVHLWNRKLRWDCTTSEIIFQLWAPCHWVCNPAYSVPVPSQHKVGGLWQEGHPAQKWGMLEVGCWLVRMEWRPAGWFACLTLLSSLAL